MNKTIVGFVFAGLLIVTLGVGLLVQLRQNTSLNRSLSKVENELLAKAKVIDEQNAFSDRFASAKRDVTESVSEKRTDPDLAGFESRITGSFPASESQTTEKQNRENQTDVFPQSANSRKAPKLPEIVEAIRTAEIKASQMAGYDPLNPPQGHTITRDQFVRLSTPQQKQYLVFARRRASQIEAARIRQRQTANSTINTVVDQYLARKKKATIAAEAASSQLVKAVQEKESADAAKFEADKKLADWQNAVNTAILNGWVTQDPPTQIIKPSTQFLNVPQTIRMADILNTAAADIEKEVAQTTKSKAEADVEWDHAAKRQVELAKAAEYWAEQFQIAEGAINERRIVQAAERQAASEASAAKAANRAADASERTARYKGLEASAANRAANAAERQARAIEMQRLLPPLQIAPTRVRIVP